MNLLKNYFYRSLLKLFSFIGLILIVSSCGSKSDSHLKPPIKPNKVVSKTDTTKEKMKVDSNITKQYIPQVIPIPIIFPDPEPRSPIGGCGYYPPEPPIELEDTFDIVPVDSVLNFAEVMPQFPGGTESMILFIKNNLLYPEIAKEIGLEGKVFVKFVVRSTGEIDNIQIARSVHKELDKSAVELVKKMPRWNPGMQNGKTVSVYEIIPIVFKLN